MSQAGLLNIKGSGTKEVATLTGNTGGAISPTVNNINIVGSGGITVTGNPITSTLTISDSGSQIIPNYTSVNHSASPYIVTNTDYYISIDASGGTVSLQFPNAPTTNRTFIIKDRNGNAAVTTISLTTPGGVVTFDGVTTFTFTNNFQAVNLLFNGSSYEVY